MCNTRETLEKIDARKQNNWAKPSVSVIGMVLVMVLLYCLLLLVLQMRLLLLQDAVADYAASTAAVAAAVAAYCSQPPVSHILHSSTLLL